MAATHTNSDIYANLVATPPVRNTRAGYVYYQPFGHTAAAAGDAGSTVKLWKCSTGVAIIVQKCTIRFSAFGASRVLDIGWEAYEDYDGNTAAANTDGLVDGLDVSAAGLAIWGSKPGDGLDAQDKKIFQAQAVLLATVAGGTWPQGATIAGVIAYMPVGS